MYKTYQKRSKLFRDTLNFSIAIIKVMHPDEGQTFIRLKAVTIKGVNLFPMTVLWHDQANRCEQWENNCSLPYHSNQVAKHIFLGKCYSLNSTSVQGCFSFSELLYLAFGSIAFKWSHDKCIFF